MTEALDISTFADLSREIYSRYRDEVHEQQLLGFTPSLVLVDGGKGQQAAGVNRKLQAFFTDTGALRDKLREAVRRAWDMLQAQTRVKSGKAKASFSIYWKGFNVGDIGSLDQIMRRFDDDDVITITGPGVAYGRKLYWRPNGPTRLVTRRKRKRIRTRTGTEIHMKMSMTYTEPMYRLVKRTMRRRYPELYSTDEWHSMGPYGQMWPALSLGIRFNRAK